MEGGSWEPRSDGASEEGSDGGRGEGIESMELRL